MKKSLTAALATLAFLGAPHTVMAENEQNGREAKARCSKLVDFYDKYQDAHAEAMLNGHVTDREGAGSNLDQDLADLVKSDDSQAGFVCVNKEGNYTVHQSSPFMVGKSAIQGEHIMRDGVGIPMVDKWREAIATTTEMSYSKKPRKLASIEYLEKQPMNNPRQGLPAQEHLYQMVVEVGENGTLCGTIARSFESTDRKSDMDSRLNEEDAPQSKKRYWKKRSHKKAKHVAQEAPKAADNTAETKAEETPKAADAS